MAKPKQQKPKEGELKEAPQSLDEAIGMGLSPLDQQKKDFAAHPKFSKFNKRGKQL